MSIIGPRPGLWNQDVLTAERDKYGANDVKPGLTGWAQINGRDELEIPEKAKLDGYYVQNMGFKMDELLSELQPDGYLVLGDTNSCLSAISAKRLHIPLFHMEAGNRCKDDLNNTETELDEYCTKADFVFNLAGVNRPENPEDFMKGNFGFASQLLGTTANGNSLLLYTVMALSRNVILIQGKL